MNDSSASSIWSTYSPTVWVVRQVAQRRNTSWQVRSTRSAVPQARQGMVVWAVRACPNP